MKKNPLRIGALLSALLMPFNPVVAQQNAAYAPQAEATNPADSEFSEQELDQLLAPIALYPDALLAQILMAATYPTEIVEAARWVSAHPKVSGQALENAMASQPWDPSVKALSALPHVLAQMNENFDWTQDLGDAFLTQPDDVMDTVQYLRGKAAENGNLKSNSEMLVRKQTQGSEVIYVVESPRPEVIYVPIYNPTVVYGSWWYSTPPYYISPPTYRYSPGLSFTTGVLVGAAIWGNFNWGGYGHNRVVINVPRYNAFNRMNINNNRWDHSAQHRRGVAYRDQYVDRLPRSNDSRDMRNTRNPRNVPATSTRDAFRGEAARPAVNSGARDLSNARERARDSFRDRQVTREVAPQVTREVAPQVTREVGPRDRQVTREIMAPREAQVTREVAPQVTREVGPRDRQVTREIMAPREAQVTREVAPQVTREVAPRDRQVTREIMAPREAAPQATREVIAPRAQPATREAAPAPAPQATREVVAPRATNAPDAAANRAAGEARSRDRGGNEARRGVRVDERFQR